MVGYEEMQDPVLAGCYGAVSASFVLEGFGALYAIRYFQQPVSSLVYIQMLPLRESIICCSHSQVDIFFAGSRCSGIHFS